MAITAEHVPFATNPLIGLSQYGPSGGGNPEVNAALVIVMGLEYLMIAEMLLEKLLHKIK